MDILSTRSVSLEMSQQFRNMFAIKGLKRLYSFAQNETVSSVSRYPVACCEVIHFGIVILAVVIFKFIPIKQRLTFMAAGLVGGVTGFVFWLILFGKIIMP